MPFIKKNATATLHDFWIKRQESKCMNEAGAGSPPPWIHVWFGYDYLDITRYGWIQTNAIGICMNKSILQ